MPDRREASVPGGVCRKLTTNYCPMHSELRYRGGRGRGRLATSVRSPSSVDASAFVDVISGAFPSFSVRFRMCFLVRRSLRNTELHVETMCDASCLAVFWDEVSNPWHLN